MAFEFLYRHRIRFADTDMAGIVHFSNYFRFMEIAEHEFLRSLKLSVHSKIDDQHVSWARVRAECSYLAPSKFEDELEIHLMVREKTKKSITYDFRICKEDSLLVAQGSVTVVCVAIDSATGKMSSISIPSSFSEKIEAAPSELIQSTP